MADTNIYNDVLVSTINDGGSVPAIAIRTGDGRTYRLIRLSDGMELQRINDLTAATARANAMITAGEVA